MEPGRSERAEDPDAVAGSLPADGDAAPARGPRSRRVRRFAVRVDSDESLLTAARRLRRQLPGDEQFGDPLSTAGAQPVEVTGDAAKPGQVLVSGPLLAQMDGGDLRAGRPKRLKADGAPRDLYIVAISRA
jgi:hypothetical protein